MLSNPYILLIAASVLLILSYGFNMLSVRTRIPSVIPLLLTGILTRQVCGWLGLEVPPTMLLLKIFGIVGLVLIVLEASIELKLEKDKAWLIIKAFLSALVILVFSSLGIAGIFMLILPEAGFTSCYANAIPFAVISSAIAIPGVSNMVGRKKEFIVYESTFSDILGILLFNLAINEGGITGRALGIVGIEVVLLSLGSIVVGILLIRFLSKAKTNVRFILLFSILILIFSIGELLEFSSLIVILLFGIVIANLHLFGQKRLERWFGEESFHTSIGQMHTMTIESAFLIRTFFFFIFGFSFRLESLLDMNVILIGVLIIFLLYTVRFIYLRFLARAETFPELLIAPRGLITVLLYYNIPKPLSLGIVSEGVLFFVVLITSLLMMYGLIRSGSQESAEQLFPHDWEEESDTSIE